MLLCHLLYGYGPFCVGFSIMIFHDAVEFFAIIFLLCHYYIIVVFTYANYILSCFVSLKTIPVKSHNDRSWTLLVYVVSRVLDVIIRGKKRKNRKNHKSAVVNGVRTGPGERRVRAEGRTLVLCFLVGLALACRSMRATWTRGRIAAVARVRPHTVHPWLVVPASCMRTAWCCTRLLTSIRRAQRTATV